MGLDISTTRIGIAVLDSDDNLIHSDLIKFKSELPLEDRAAIFESIMRKVNTKYVPFYVYIEKQATNFRSGSTAHVMDNLKRFSPKQSDANVKELSRRHQVQVCYWSFLFV